MNEAIEIVAEITAAAENQTGEINSITTGIGEISDVIQSNTATAEESASSSEELNGQAVALKKMISGFTLE